MYKYVYRMTVIKLGDTTPLIQNNLEGIYAGQTRDEAMGVGWTCMSINWGVPILELRDNLKYQVIWETLKEPQ